MPSRLGAIVLLMLATALDTPFPIHRFLSPSRSSIASFSPVDAPDGTAARPRAPLSNTTSTSTVGFPRESRICRPLISRITLISLFPHHFPSKKINRHHIRRTAFSYAHPLHPPFTRTERMLA